MPGDKSLAHRALILAALAQGESAVSGLPNGADVLSTVACVRALGTQVAMTDGRATVRAAVRAPAVPLDAGNSGTTMRLMAGVLSGRPFTATLTGDVSLSRRPMGRVVEPLTLMGAAIETDAGRAPLTVTGGQLRGIRYTLPVASAQVKSAVLLAGLTARGETTVVEPIPTRDHTERLLAALGADIGRDAGSVTVRPSALAPFHFNVPGDPSSAAFLAASAVLHGTALTISGVSLNPHRLGFFRAIARMGVTVDLVMEEERLGEPVGTIHVSGRARRPIAIAGNEVPSLIDEIPLLALLASAADGISTIRGARELRVKETDRIAAAADILTRLGVAIEPREDGFIVRGPTRLLGARVSSHGDHRLAMMAAIAGTAARGETVVDGAEAADVSYPGFARAISALGGEIAVD